MVTENVTITNCFVSGFDEGSMLDGTRTKDVMKTNGTGRIKLGTLVAHIVAFQAGILIAGEPGHPVEDVTLSNILIEFAGGGTEEEARREVPKYERNGRYPEPGFFGTLPSWGLFARHVKNLKLDQVELRTATEDRRPPVYLEDAADVRFTDVTLPHPEDVPDFNLKDVRNFVTRDCVGVENWRVD